MGNGYGQINLASIGRWSAHALAYVLTNGPVPDGLHIDHICHNDDLSCAGGSMCPHRRCCNPAHLEATSPGENKARADIPRERTMRETCPQGHPMDGVLVRKSGPKKGKRERYCKTCNREKVAARKVSLSNSR